MQLIQRNKDSAYLQYDKYVNYDNPIVAAKAKELNIRDCVSISNHIGPFLIVNGEAQDIVGIAGGTNPRTAIGQTADGKILLLAVDGRQPNSIGATFSDLQDIMAQYGAVNASTMDGGTSTQFHRPKSRTDLLCQAISRSQERLRPTQPWDVRQSCYGQPAAIQALDASFARDNLRSSSHNVFWLY